MKTIEQAKNLKDQAYALEGYIFETLEEMKPGSKTYKRLLNTHQKAHLRWERREKTWFNMGGSYRG